MLLVFGNLNILTINYPEISLPTTPHQTNMTQDRQHVESTELSDIINKRFVFNTLFVKARARKVVEPSFSFFDNLKKSSLFYIMRKKKVTYED